MFKLNFPWLKTRLCSPKITISGLSSAIAATGPMPIFDAVPDTTSRFSNVTTHAAWDNAASAKSLTLTVQNSTEADRVYGIGFTVRNPARAQTCQSPFITVKGCGDVTSILGVSAAPNNGQLLACAMTIQELKVTHAFIQQSSPFPCDNNTITVGSSSTLPLLTDGAPCLTTQALDLSALPEVPRNCPS